MAVGAQALAIRDVTREIQNGCLAPQRLLRGAGVFKLFLSSYLCGVLKCNCGILGCQRKCRYVRDFKEIVWMEMTEKSFFTFDMVEPIALFSRC